MGAGKKRATTQVIGEMGVNILKALFPKEWVCREYTPDYGIDLGVELFSPHKDGFITKGEHLLFQVKGTHSPKVISLPIRPRLNVERASELKPEKVSVIDAISFPIDTDLLSTVEVMGSAVPVILTVVDIENSSAYFVCLNDYIEKVIVPDKPNYRDQGSVTIHIPIKNSITEPGGIKALEWYAKRAKLYALFNKINYQNREIQYCDEDTFEEQINHFIQIVTRSDAWSAAPYFGAMSHVKQELDYYLEHGITKDAENMIRHAAQSGQDVDTKEWESTYCTNLVSFRQACHIQGLHQLWSKMTLMGDAMEDVAKEAFLPTHLGVVMNDLE